MTDSKPDKQRPGAASPLSRPADSSTTPRDLKVKIKEQRLRVDWSDGTHSEFALAQLRAQCPCATCRTDREEAKKNPLRILRSDPTDIRVISAELVGNYAIQFVWSDGHSAGIFDFRFLRSLDANI